MKERPAAGDRKPRIGLDQRRHRRVRRRLRRGTYLLPSVFTTGNILLGFYAVVLGTRDRFEDAAIAILIAGVLDALDGRIARLTGTESEFGKEFDSLADILTFGAAPALLAYLWGLDAYGRAGWLIPLYFLLCTAIRLARFNVQTRVVDSRSFVGLPSPAAAGAIMALLFSAPRPDIWRFWAWWLSPTLVEGVMIFALLVVGSLMISTFRYPSGKKIDLRERWSYRAFMTVAAFLLVLAYRPAAFLLTAALLYTLSGPAAWLWSRFRRRDEAAEPDVERSEPSAVPD
jgi:CDP-diacylglycerol--serine O-phosphatidyltransferase